VKFAAKVEIVDGNGAHARFVHRELPSHLFAAKTAEVVARNGSVRQNRFTQPAVFCTERIGPPGKAARSARASRGASAAKATRSCGGSITHDARTRSRNNVAASLVVVLFG
jgi:hypothetical protein